MKAKYFATSKKASFFLKPVTSIRKYLPLLLFVAFALFLHHNASATKRYNINSVNSFTGAGTYCQNATPSDLTIVLNTCNSGGGSASATTFTITWYSNTSNSTIGGTQVAQTTNVSTGTSATVTLTYTPSTSTAGTLYYYVVLSNPSYTNCGFNPTLTSVTQKVIVNGTPAAVTVSGGGSFCNNTTITASGGTGGTIYYQGTTINGTSTTTASSSQVVSTSGTYYFRSYNGSCWGTQGSVTVTISTPPAAVTVSGGGTFCGSTTITASGGGGGTIYFEGTTSNGTSTATPSGSQVVSSSGTYYFRSYNGSCWGTQGSVTVSINAAPTAVSVSGGGTFCTNTTITASGGTGGTIYFEGTTSNGTSTATPSSSQLISTSGTYYFRAYNGSCWSTQGSATVTVNTYYAPGTYSVGPTGTFTSIGNGLAAISTCPPITGAYIFELQSTYVSSVETFPLNIPMISGTSATNTITIRPATGATNRSITSNNTTRNPQS